MASTHNLTAAKLFDLTGWVCVVTGGGSGIGLMASQALSANGATVYITSRRGEVLEKASDVHDSDKTHGKIIPCRTTDVTKKSDLEALVKEIEEKEDHVDMLLTASGISGPKAEPDSEDANELKKTLWEGESFEEWAETYNTDVTAVYFTSVAFLPLLQKATKKRGNMSGNIIVISSMSGIMRHAQGHFSYNTAKGGTVHLTKLMSGEFQKAGIRVNSIAPGYFPSEMTAKESDSDQKSQLPDSKIQEKGHVPMQRAGADEEMAMGVLLLAKNSYINGEILAIDGGVLNVVAGR